MKQALFVVAALALQTGYAQSFEIDFRRGNPSDSDAVHDNCSFTLNSSKPAFLSGFNLSQSSHATNSGEFGQIFAPIDLSPRASLLEAAWRYNISIIREAGENREPWNDLPLEPWMEVTPWVEPAFEGPVLTLAAAGGRGEFAYHSIGAVRSVARHGDRVPRVFASKDARYSYGKSASYGALSTVAILFDPETLNGFSITDEDGRDKPLRAFFAPVDVPEPSTYAAATALLLAAYTMMRRIRR